MIVTKFLVVNGTPLTIVLMRLIVSFFGIMRLGTGRTLIRRVIDRIGVGVTPVEHLGDLISKQTVILSYSTVLMVVQ